MKHTHTSGPWKIDLPNGTFRTIYAPDINICTLYRQPNIDANARLVAAAPDLLAALEDLLCAGGPIWHMIPDADARWREVRNARAAIAKATGQA